MELERENRGVSYDDSYDDVSYDDSYCIRWNHIWTDCNKV